MALRTSSCHGFSASVTGPPNTRNSCQTVMRNSSAHAEYWKMENASVTKGKYCSMAVISVPKASKKIPETASMMLVTMDATQFTMLSKIQPRSNPAHLPGAGRYNMGFIRCTYRLESRAASMPRRNPAC